MKCENCIYYSVNVSGIKRRGTVEFVPLHKSCYCGFAPGEIVSIPEDRITCKEYTPNTESSE